MIGISIINNKKENDFVQKLKDENKDFFLIMNGKYPKEISVLNIFGEYQNQSIILFKHNKTVPENKVHPFGEKFDEIFENEDSTYLEIGGEKMSNNELVVAIAAEGYATKIVEVARAAGANGATFIPARGSGADMASFMGIPIENEKEVTLIVADKKVSAKICEDVGNVLYNGDQRIGIAFCMPLSFAHFPDRIKSEETEKEEKEEKAKEEREETK